MNYYNDRLNVEIYDIIPNISYKVKLTDNQTNESISDLLASKTKTKKGYVFMVRNINLASDFIESTGLTRRDVLIAIKEEYFLLTNKAKKESADKIASSPCKPSFNVSFSTVNSDQGRYIATLSREDSTYIGNILVICKDLSSSQININYPFANRNFPWNDISIDSVTKRIIKEFKEYIESGNADTPECMDTSPAETISVQFYDESPQEGFCYAQISTASEAPISNIKILNSSAELPQVCFEDTVVNDWPWTSVTIKTARKILMQSAKNYMLENNYETYQPPSRTTKVHLRNELGRIINADNSLYKYYPDTVLRRKKKDKSDTGTWFRLIEEMSKETNPIVSETEFDILSWVNTLRYVSKNMLFDLYQADYISTGWRKFTKIDTIISNLDEYGLVNLTRLATRVDEATYKPVPTEIYTLGGNGARLLREIGRSGYFNSFDIYQDGNEAKRRLVANQWLVFMLTHFKDRVCGNYMVDYKIYLMSSQRSGARIATGVNLEDKFIICEPIRRVDEAIRETTISDNRNKFERLNVIFEHPDDIYTGDRTKFVFPHRPIICYICEDNEHIIETMESLKDLFDSNPQQEVWFTTDLNTFNQDIEGNRFYKYCDGELVGIDEFD